MISVLMTTYNSSQFVVAAVTSILNQSFKEFELVVVDDGSTDDTVRLIELIMDVRIRLVRREHLGRGEALNYGVTLCDNDLIALMDSDDIAHPLRLEKQIKYMGENSEVDVLSGWYAVFSDSKIKYLVMTPENSSAIKKRLILDSPILNSGVIFRKRIFDDGAYYKNHPFEDYELWLRMRDKLCFHNLSYIIAFVRHHSDSFSRNNISEKQRLHYDIQGQYYKGENIYKFVDTEYEANIFRGFREFFYGSKTNARSYWNKLGVILFVHPRILIAYLMTFLSVNTLTGFKETRARLRLAYHLNYFSKTNCEVRGLLKQILKNGNRFTSN
jgi:glycosyltransferase involved in cell wall biosynthesis